MNWQGFTYPVKSLCMWSRVCFHFLTLLSRKELKIFFDDVPKPEKHFSGPEIMLYTTKFPPYESTLRAQTFDANNTVKVLNDASLETRLLHILLTANTLSCEEQMV